MKPGGIMKPTRAIGLLTLLIAFVGCSMDPAFAVDGVTLIDQNKALMGNVTLGDAPGFPVTISQPGSYRLSGNLTVPDANTSAIQINTGNVTIDLNGFALIGPVVCSSGQSGGVAPGLTGSWGASCSAVGSGRGITNAGSDAPRIAVRNGAVSGMGSHGINLSNIGHAIEGVRVSSNGGDGINVESAVVSHNNVVQNGQRGIAVLGAASVSYNVVLNNGTDGIHAGGGAVSHNSVKSNGHYGILGQGSVVSHNLVHSNASYGLLLGSSGYLGNAVGNNNLGGAQVSGGVSMGGNVCGGVPC
jgi:hypothetical protein